MGIACDLKIFGEIVRAWLADDDAIGRIIDADAGRASHQWNAWLDEIQGFHRRGGRAGRRSEAAALRMGVNGSSREQKGAEEDVRFDHADDELLE